MTNRAAEYRQVISDVLDQNQELKAKVGMDLIEEDEWAQLNDLVNNVLAKIKPAEAAE